MYGEKNGQVTIEQEFAAAEKDYRTVHETCDRFDRELMDEAAACGGKRVCRAVCFGLPSGYCRP